MSEIGWIQSGNYIDRLVAKVETPCHQWLCGLIASHSKISFIHDCYDLLWQLCLDYVDPPQPPTFAATSRILRSSGFFIFGFKPWTTNNEQRSYSIQDVTIKWQSKTHMTHMAKTLRHGVQKSHILCAKPFIDSQLTSGVPSTANVCSPSLPFKK